MTDWIACEERLPPIRDRVLFVDAAGIQWIGWHSNGEWHRYADDRDFPYIVTHWMLLPEPPR